MSLRPVAVFIDHQEAKIFHLDPDSSDVAHVHAPTHHVHRHETRTTEPNRAADARHFHHDVAVAMADAKQILVLGPASAKLELVKDWKSHEQVVAAKVIGVETVDHPTDNQIVALARTFFKAADRMRGNA
jgi:hypothetical protein